MSIATADAEPRQEIIIVRRSYDQEDGHHGGVWKIAFADFMTAMMCFFLVMWLINAANEQTKAAVASYFNPVKLIDRNSSKKGLDEMGAAGTVQEDSGSPGRDNGAEASAEARKSSPEEAPTKDVAENQSDKYLFANPYAVLSEIAEETGVLQNVSERGDGGAQTSGPSTGAQGGRAYRDPFAPDFWTEQMVLRGNTAEGEKSTGTGLPANERETPSSSGNASGAPSEPASRSASSPFSAAPLEPLAETEQPAAKTDERPAAATVKAADDIRDKLAAALGPDNRLAEGMTVVAGKDGVTVSVTDRFDFGMFEVGSAMPRRELVLAMEKIGKVLAEQKGTITVEGHTDARPFRNETYDNWRLSSARAHSAYYMLVRGGLDENRITAVTGHADRRLKDRDDPLSAVNRRIEILLDIDGG